MIKFTGACTHATSSVRSNDTVPRYHRSSFSSEASTTRFCLCNSRGAVTAVQLNSIRATATVRGTCDCGAYRRRSVHGEREQPRQHQDPWLWDGKMNQPDGIDPAPVDYWMLSITRQTQHTRLGHNRLQTALSRACERFGASDACTPRSAAMYNRGNA
jgi:hypothetical protein